MNMFNADFLVAYIKKYKLFIAPIFIVLIFFSVLMLLFTTNNTQQTLPTPTPTSIPFVSQAPSVTEQKEEAENPDPVEKGTGLQSKVTLSDGTTKYTFESPVAGRPNTTITSGEENNILFERSVIPQNQNTPAISEYLNAYGQTNNVITGSRFYGSSAQTYIYAEKGVAFIASPQTGKVLELHTFVPTSRDNYIQKYGEDIQNPTPGL